MGFAERDGYRSMLKGGDLSAQGQLEQVISEHYLKFDKDRRKWSREIFKKLAELEAELDSSEPRLEKMSRILGLCQGMKLFGSLHWYCEQCKAPPGKGIVED